MIGDASSAGFLLLGEMVEKRPTTQRQDFASEFSLAMVGRNCFTPTEQAMATSVIQPQMDGASDSAGAFPWGSSMLSQFTLFLRFHCRESVCVCAVRKNLWLIVMFLLHFTSIPFGSLLSSNLPQSRSA
jgi:hypothetical protein